MKQKESFENAGLEAAQFEQTHMTHEGRMIFKQLSKIDVDLAYQIVPKWAQEILITEGQRREVEGSIKAVGEIVVILENALRYFQASIAHLDSTAGMDYLAKVAEEIFPEELGIPEDWEEFTQVNDTKGDLASVVKDARDVALRLSRRSFQKLTILVNRAEQMQLPVIKKRLPPSLLKPLRIFQAKPGAGAGINTIETDDQRIEEITAMLFILEFNIAEYAALLSEFVAQKIELQAKQLELIHSLEPDQLSVLKIVIKEKYLEEGMFLASRRFPQDSDSFIQ